MPSTTLSDICISELDVFRVLSSLDVTKAKGCDGISPKLLKNCALSLYQPLHHLFSLSLSQKYLPLEWRTHLIKPIFKSGDKSSIRNYRPISLLSVVSKVLEKLVFNSIVDFVSDSISVSQFGFLRGRSTLQQMLVFFNTLLSSASQTDVIYLDFKKAFDSVAHNKLLCKLWKFGITGDLWELTCLTESSMFLLANQLLPRYLLSLVCHKEVSLAQFSFSSLLTICPLRYPFPRFYFLLTILSASCQFVPYKTV